MAYGNLDNKIMSTWAPIAGSTTATTGSSSPRGSTPRRSFESPIYEIDLGKLALK